MEVKRGYKQTEVGILPEAWSVEPLGDYVQITSGESPSLLHFATNGFPYFKVEQLSNSEKYLDSFSTPYHFENGKTVPRGSVIFAKRGAAIALNKVRILAHASFMDTNLMALTPSEELDVEYLYYALGYIGLWRFADITSVPQINNKHVKPLAFPLPKVDEQRAIAEVLSDADALLGGLGRLIAKKRNLKQSVMQQLLTGQIRLPSFHGEWKKQLVAELEKQQLVKLSRGQVISKKDIENSPGDFPIYSSSVHNDGLFGRYGKFMFEEELITWSVDGGGDFFHRRKHKFSVTNVCGFMRVDTSRISYRFFAAQLQLLHSHKSFDYQSKAHPSVVRKEYEVQLPPLSEQIAIAEVLSDIDAELAALELRREKARTLKQGMMQELLTGKTRLV
jgi:type I restriction enzyme, S subunit